MTNSNRNTPTEVHRAIQVMQFVNRNALLVTMHVCDDCRQFRHETHSPTPTVLFRDEDLNPIAREKVSCPSIRCLSCETSRPHLCHWLKDPNLRPTFSEPQSQEQSNQP